MWFRHPKPFIQKPVAMQMVKRDAAPAPDTQSITVAHATPTTAAPPATLADAAMLGGEAGPGVPAEPIRFRVVYTLRDYLGVLLGHAAAAVAMRRKRPPAASPFKRIGLPMAGLALIAAALHGFGLMQPVTLAVLVCVMLLMSAPFSVPAWVVLIGTPMYFYKRWRMPVCDFSIDADAVTRVSAAGKLVKPWSELREAKVYAGSYVLAFAKGAIPVPQRCLSAAQAARMRLLIAAAREGQGQA